MIQTTITEPISGTEGAKAFLHDLYCNDELFGPDDDARYVDFEEKEVTDDDRNLLNSRMEEAIEAFEERGWDITEYVEELIFSGIPT